MVFCFVQNFFFGQHKSQNIYFFVVQSAKYFSSTKFRIFFSATLGIRIFFQKKTIPPPFKLNDRSLSTTLKYNRSLKKHFILFSFRFLLSTSTDFTAVLIMSSMIPLIILSLDTDDTVRNLAQNFPDRSCAYSCSCSFSTNNVFPNLLSFQFLLIT